MKAKCHRNKLARRDFLRQTAMAGISLASSGCLAGQLTQVDRDRPPGKAPVKRLITTLGPKAAEDVGLILPHEHIFVDLRRPDDPGFAQADPEEVVQLMAPQIEQAQAVGVTTIVEATPVGVGRRADLVKAVSDATAFPVLVPTGIYREPWVPAWAHEASEDELYDWMLGELQGEIEDSGVQAAWIKLSAGDDGITQVEAKILRAAARAGTKTGAIIGSHTRLGRVVQDQLDLVNAVGYTLQRFIWIHAQNDRFELNLETARRGAWIEYDGIGGAGKGDDFYLDRVLGMMDAGLADRVLLSQDRGWYDPGKPKGGAPKPYTYLSERFLPQLRQRGADEATLRQLTYDNPFRAFAR